MLIDLLKSVDNYNMSIKGVIHIGAHHGQENKIYDSLMIENRIFVEPLKSNFDVLKQNVGEQHMLINKALGNDNKKIRMFVETANKGQSSSILKPIKHLIQYPHIKFESTEEVEMTKLDDINFDRSKYNFINIDVQGYELEVFKGSTETLNNIDYIVAEVNRDEVYEDCPMVEELDNFLSPYGFERVETSWDGQTWGDALYLKK